MSNVARATQGVPLFRFHLRKTAEKKGRALSTVKFDRPIHPLRYPVGTPPPTPGKEPAVQPILADLETARTNVILNSAPTDTLATNALNAAITKLQALKSEDVTAIVALCNSAKANIALLTGPGDAAALTDIANAKTLVGKL